MEYDKTILYQFLSNFAMSYRALYLETFEFANDTAPLSYNTQVIQYAWGHLAIEIF